MGAALLLRLMTTRYDIIYCVCFWKMSCISLWERFFETTFNAAVPFHFICELYDRKCTHSFRMYVYLLSKRHGTAKAHNTTRLTLENIQQATKVVRTRGQQRSNWLALWVCQADNTWWLLGCTNHAELSCQRRSVSPVQGCLLKLFSVIKKASMFFCNWK